MTKISHAISGVHTKMSSTDSFMPPKGTTAQRPTLTASEEGAIRYNTTTQRQERSIGVGNTFRQVGIHGHFNSCHLADFSITTTAQAIPFNTNDLDSGTSISHSTTVNNTRFAINDSGTYEFVFQPQVESLVANPARCIFWINKNGAALPNSAVEYRITGTGTTNVIPIAVNLAVATAGDYFEVMCIATNNSEYFLNYTAPAGAVPAIPAIIASLRGW
jgi:hypothetical protein